VMHGLAGRIVAAPARPTGGRNDSCPCGSGKKFKKCCGGGYA
jgi:SEC-C motif-containing protein